VAAARVAAPKILALRERAHEAKVPTIYVNDNFGQWRSDFRATFAACTAPDQPGRDVARLLQPTEDDYFVLKPRHSAFYCTALEPLLAQLGVKKLVLAGFATNICLLFTTNDAHMRGYDVWVPSDCTASNSAELTAQALAQLRITTEAQVVPSAEIDLAALRYAKSESSART
jgi:nicotinamidase-related amidase